MHNFFQWCEEKENDLGAVLKDVEEIEGEKKDEGGAAKRAAGRAAYPSGYGRNQYTQGYFRPYSATADNDFEHNGDSKGKKKKS